MRRNNSRLSRNNSSQSFQNYKFVIVGISDMNCQSRSPFDTLQIWSFDASNSYQALKQCILNDDTSSIKDIIESMFSYNENFFTNGEIRNDFYTMSTIYNQYNYRNMTSNSQDYYNFIIYYIDNLVRLFNYFAENQLFIRIEQI